MLLLPTIQNTPLHEAYNDQYSGFASPACDYMNGRLDLHRLLIHRPHATFYFRVESSDMVNHGMDKDDILVVDRSLVTRKQDMAIIVYEGEFLVRQYAGDQWLSDHQVILVAQSRDIVIWGVVTAIIKICRKR